MAASLRYGSIGKQLLTAFVHGKQTHAGYPQDGVNAAYVAAELLTEFELVAVAVGTHGRGDWRHLRLLFTQRI